MREHARADAAMQANLILWFANKVSTIKIGARNSVSSHTAPGDPLEERWPLLQNTESAAIDLLVWALANAVNASIDGASLRHVNEIPPNSWVMEYFSSETQKARSTESAQIKGSLLAWQLLEEQMS